VREMLAWLAVYALFAVLIYLLFTNLGRWLL
jgi:hypothetical protein